MRQRLFAGFDSLAVNQGGVARVGRLMARVLTDPAIGLGVPVTAATLLDAVPPAELSLSVSPAGGSQARFAAAVVRATLTHSHFLYGFIGLARAHGWLPWPRRPFLGFIHGIEVWQGRWESRGRVRAAERAALLVSNSAHTRDRAAQLHPTFARAAVCWLGTEQDDPPPPTPPRAGPPRVLIVGRLDEGRKGHQQLIRCWPRVLDAVPDAVLTVAGRGPLLDEFRQLAAGSGAGHRIEFLGFVPEADMPELWRQTSVFAMPGRGEGFGLTYIEAMRYGVPVIASVHDAGQEVNLDGVTGFNINLDHPDELGDRLIFLLREPDRAASLGEHGRARWAEHFRYTAFRDRFLPHVRRLLEWPS